MAALPTQYTRHSEPIVLAWSNRNRHIPTQGPYFDDRTRDFRYHHYNYTQSSSSDSDGNSDPDADYTDAEISDLDDWSSVEDDLEEEEQEIDYGEDESDGFNSEYDFNEGNEEFEAEESDEDETDEEDEKDLSTNEIRKDFWSIVLWLNWLNIFLFVVLFSSDVLLREA